MGHQRLDFDEVLAPTCKAVVSTGAKSAEIVCGRFRISKMPDIGSTAVFEYEGRELKFCRAPSSSRAYPLPLAEKAEIYKSIFDNLL